MKKRHLLLPPFFKPRAMPAADYYANKKRLFFGFLWGCAGFCGKWRSFFRQLEATVETLFAKACREINVDQILIFIKFFILLLISPRFPRFSWGQKFSALSYIFRGLLPVICHAAQEEPPFLHGLIALD
ncbi:hypothetical protein [Acidaminobacterium chupaoyuni]